jgi:hypothetical protein
MAQTSLNQFKTDFLGGTRQNRFEIQGVIPYSGGALSSFHVRSSLIPTLQTSTIVYDYLGRKSFFPGEKMYSTWSFAVLDDPSSGANNLWQKFQSWQNRINNHFTNVSDVSAQQSTEPSYKAFGWRINQLDLNGNTIKTFMLNGCWPRSVNEISFNMGRPNVLNTFNVVFVFDTVQIFDRTVQITNTNIT